MMLLSWIGWRLNCGSLSHQWSGAMWGLMKVWMGETLQGCKVCQIMLADVSVETVHMEVKTQEAGLFGNEEPIDMFEI